MQPRRAVLDVCHALLAADGALSASLTAVVEAVVAENHAAVGGVSEQLHRALVVGFLHDVVDRVELDLVVVALDPHGTARTVIHQVVRYAVAHAFKLDGRRVGSVDASEIVDSAVLDKVPAGLEGGTVATDDLGGSPADSVNVAAQQSVGLATLNSDPIARHTADGGAGNQAAATVRKHQPVVASQIEGQSFEADVGDRVHRHHRCRKQADLHGHIRQIGGRIEIKDAARAVQIPLSGLVDLFEQVEGVVLDALAVVHPRRAVLVGLGSGDGVRCRINVRNFDRGVGPDVAEVTEQPCILGFRPAGSTIINVLEHRGLTVRLRAGLHQLADADETLVGPARQGHWPTIDEQLQGWRRRWLGKSSDGELAVVGDTEGAQIALHNVAALLFRQPLQDGRVSHALEPSEPPAAIENRFARLDGLVHHRVFGRTGVLL